MSGPRSGQVLAGRYMLVRALPRGSQTRVWEATDQRSGRVVATKLSSDHQQLLAEFRLLQQLTHPSIVAVYDLFRDDCVSGLVMELADGLELRESMGSSPQEWIPQLRPVLDALRYLHGQGIVHGDLSLQNIIVAAGRGRLVDFGKAAPGNPQQDLAALGVIITELATGMPAVPDGIASLSDPRLDSLVAKLQRNHWQPELSDIAAQLDQIVTRPQQDEQFETIEPVGREAAPPAARASAPHLTGRPWLLIIPAALLILLAAVLVPRWLDPGQVNLGNGGAGNQSAASLRLERQRAQLEQQRTAIYEDWLKLQAIRVDDWAGQRATRAREHLQEAERLAGRFELGEAIRELQAMQRLVRALQDEAPAIAEFHRQAGMQALRAADGALAQQHLVLALAIEPENRDAREALQRAAHVEQTAALRREALRLENSGALRSAIDKLQEALAIDPDNGPLQAEIQRLESRLQSNQFADQMSRLYAALRENRFAAARDALGRARNIRPGASELGDAQVQIDTAEREAMIRQLRARAAEAENGEQWEQAIGLYGELLQMDPALVFAQQGRDRSRLLASLSSRADTLLASADFTTPEQRRQAQTLADQIGALQNETRGLQDLRQRLESALQQAKEPVTVVLESDSQTEILIYRVGPLGRFERQQIELLPGRYTVLGRCEGYRDVRHELVVQPGTQPAPLEVRCEERI